jgi:uncharacterized protein (TIGR02996 family)
MTRTSDEAFLQDIRENPEDDAPRLVYADWLDERGQAERAEFIRIQCRLARAPHALGSPVLRRREQELLKQHAKEWRAPLRKFANKIEFFRGFPGFMVLSPTAFIKHAEDIFRLAPVSHVKFRMRADERELAGDLGRCPALAGVTTIDLQANNLGGDRAGKLLGSPHLTRLRHLKLNNNGLGNKGMQVLSGLPVLGQLESLDLTGNNIGTVGLGALAASPHLTTLKSLTLTRNPDILGEGLQALASSPQVRGLERLTLWELVEWNGAGLPSLSTGVQALAGSSHFQNLQTLDLGRNSSLDTQTLSVLSATEHLPRLSDLRLYGTDVPLGGTKGPSEWLTGPLVRRLERLDLSGREIDAAGIRALTSLPPLERLRHLDLSGTRFKWTDRLARAPVLSHLTWLGLGQTEAGDRQARWLASSSLSNLEVLDLTRNEVGKAGARALLDSPHLARALIYIGVHLAIASEGLTELEARYPDRLDLYVDSPDAPPDWD